MKTFLSIIIGIFIFGIIVIVHEFGHYITAKLCKVRVTEFAIGMGPVIYQKKGKETTFSLRLLPLGGFCSMGEDEDSDDPNSFRKKPVPAKMAVILAGAFMNSDNVISANSEKGAVWEINVPSDVSEMTRIGVMFIDSMQTMKPLAKFRTIYEVK